MSGTDHDQKVIELCRIISQLEAIELTVVLMVARRILMGQKTIGILKEDDPRDWRKELTEELADGVVYAMLEVIRNAK